MARWNETEQLELLESLLKRGFSVPVRDYEDYRDRILFYLQLAASFYEDGLYEIDGDVAVHPDDRKLMWQHRKQLALVAFGELVEHFFKTEDKDFFRTGRKPGWARYVTDPLVVEALLSFFCIESYREVRATKVRGELPKQHAQAAGAFLLNLCKLGWLTYYNGNGRGYESWSLGSDDSPALLFDHQPDLLERLIVMGKWSWLLDISQYPLTPASQERLEQLAFAPGLLLDLKNPGGPRAERKPISLEEAVANNNEAAHILVIRRVKENEDARMSELQAALKEADAAVARVKAAT